MEAATSEVRVHPGSIQSFYTARRALKIAAVVLPLLVLGGALWLVNEVLLAPSRPGPTASADQVFQYIVDEKGFARLGEEASEEFLNVQMQRLNREPAFRNAFLAVTRVATNEEQKAFAERLFDAYAPRFLADVDRYEAVPEPQRIAFLDQRLVDLARLAKMWEGVRVNRSQVGGGLHPMELLELIKSKTSEEQRDRAMKYFGALGARGQQVMADPELRADFERRVKAE